MAWVGPYSVAALTTQIRTRSDREDDAQWATTAFMQQLILDSYDDFWDMLCRCLGEDFDEATFDATVPAGVVDTPQVLELPWWDGTSPFGLDDPRPFWRLKRCEFLRGEHWYPMQRIHLGAQVMRRQPVVWRPGVPRYRLTARKNTAASTLTFEPLNSGTQDVRVVYIPAPPFTFDEEGGVELSFYGYEEWLILDVCRKLAMKAGEDASQWMAERERYEQRVRLDAPPRDIGQAPLLGNVDARDPPEWGDFGGIDQ